MAYIVSFFKYIALIIFSLVSFVIWSITFVIQGAINSTGNLYFLPLKLLLIFSVVGVLNFIIFKLFDHKRPNLIHIKWSVIMGIINIALSLSFTYIAINPHFGPITLKDESFSQAPRISTHSGNLTTELGNSLFAYASLIPFNAIDRDLLKYLSNAFLENSLVPKIDFYLREGFDGDLCKNYTDRYLSNCLYDLQKDLLSQLKFTSTGNISFLASLSKIIEEQKENQEEENKAYQTQVMISSLRQLILSHSLIIEATLKTVQGEREKTHFKMGYSPSEKSIIWNIEKLINYQLIFTASEEVQKIIQQAQIKLDEIKQQITPDSEIFTLRESQEISKEIEKYTVTEEDYLFLQATLIDYKELLKQKEEIQKQLKVDFPRLNTESTIYKILKKYIPELEQMNIEELLKLSS